MRKQGRRAGMTMIELISALALFVIIFGTLMIILRAAMHLWAPEQSNQQDQIRGETVMDILVSDFYQGFADNGAAVHLSTNEPSFVLDCDTNTLATAAMDPKIVLYFARHASPKIASQDPPMRASLDAVFYVCYSNCLSRHVYPLQYDSWTDDTRKTLGELLRERYSQLSGEIQDIYGWLPSGIPGTSEGLHSLLADRCEFAALAILPPALVRQETGSIEPLVILDRCEAFALPDILDVALVLYNDEDWNKRQRILNGTLPHEEAERIQGFLGKLFSKRIAFPAKGGSRL